MSSHPSPGPSHSAPQNTSAPSTRRPRPTHSIGIAAGAEDVKYQAKYKDLKRKVKEIEAVSSLDFLVHLSPFTHIYDRKTTNSISKPYKLSGVSSG